jgi:hypothetical protein
MSGAGPGWSGQGRAEYAAAARFCNEPWQFATAVDISCARLSSDTHRESLLLLTSLSASFLTRLSSMLFLQVISACAAGFLWQAFTMPGDGLNATVGGMLRGAGRQELGAVLNLASYWGLGLPGAYLLGVRAGWGLKGLWAGLIICTSVQAVVMLVVLFRFDWQREAERAVELAAASGGDGGSGSCGAAAAQRLPCEDSAVKLYPGRAAASDVELA